MPLKANEACVQLITKRDHAAGVVGERTVEENLEHPQHRLQ